MLRLKLIGIVLVLGVLGVAGTLLLVGLAKGDADEALQQRLATSAQAWTALEELRDRRLVEIAGRVQASELPARLAALRALRERLYAAEKALYRQHPKDPRARAAAVAGYGDLLDAYARAVADELAARRGPFGLSARRREALERSERAALARCLPVAVSQCAFELTYPALQAVADALEGLGPRPDHLVVADDRFVGIAQAEQPLWSDRESFGDEVPLVQATQSGIVARDLVRVGDDPRHHVALAAPLTDARGRFVGAVLVTRALDDTLLGSEREALGVDVTWLIDGAPVRSTLPTEALEPIAAAVRQAAGQGGEGARTYALEASGDVVAALVPIARRGDAAPAHVALSVDRGAALGHLDALATRLALLGALLILGALAAMAWAWRGFATAAEAIELALDEVAEGDRQPPLPSDWPEPTWRAIAGAANRALAARGGAGPASDAQAWAAEVLSEGGEPPGGSVTPG